MVPLNWKIEELFLYEIIGEHVFDDELHISMMDFLCSRGTMDL